MPTAINKYDKKPYEFLYWTENKGLHRLLDFALKSKTPEVYITVSNDKKKGVSYIHAHGDTGLPVNYMIEPCDYVVAYQGLIWVLKEEGFMNSFEIPVETKALKHEETENDYARINKFLLEAEEAIEKDIESPTGRSGPLWSQSRLLDIRGTLSDYFDSETLYEESAQEDASEYDSINYDLALVYRITSDFDEGRFLEFLEPNTVISTTYTHCNDQKTFVSVNIVNPVVKGTFVPGDCAIKCSNGRIVHAPTMYKR
jgi:hypothetical protein